MLLESKQNEETKRLEEEIAPNKKKKMQATSTWPVDVDFDLYDLYLEGMTLPEMSRALSKIMDPYYDDDDSRRRGDEKRREEGEEKEGSCVSAHAFPYCVTLPAVVSLPPKPQASLSSSRRRSVGASRGGSDDATTGAAAAKQRRPPASSSQRTASPSIDRGEEEDDDDDDEETKNNRKEVETKETENRVSVGEGEEETASPPRRRSTAHSHRSSPDNRGSSSSRRANKRSGSSKALSSSPPRSLPAKRVSSALSLSKVGDVAEQEEEYEADDKKKNAKAGGGGGGGSHGGASDLPSSLNNDNTTRQHHHHHCSHHPPTPSVLATTQQQQQLPIQALVTVMLPAPPPLRRSERRFLDEYVQEQYQLFEYLKSSGLESPFTFVTSTSVWIPVSVRFELVRRFYALHDGVAELFFGDRMNRIDDVEDDDLEDFGVAWLRPLCLQRQWKNIKLVCKTVTAAYRVDRGSIHIPADVPLVTAIEEIFMIPPDLARTYAIVVFGFEHRLDNDALEELDIHALLSLCMAIQALWCDATTLFLNGSFVKACGAVGRALSESRVRTEFHAALTGEGGQGILKQLRETFDGVQKAIAPASTTGGSKGLPAVSSTMSLSTPVVLAPTVSSSFAGASAAVSAFLQPSLPPSTPSLAATPTAAAAAVGGGGGSSFSRQPSQSNLAAAAAASPPSSTTTTVTTAAVAAPSPAVMMSPPTPPPPPPVTPTVVSSSSSSAGLFTRRFQSEVPSILSTLQRMLKSFGSSRRIRDVLEAFHKNIVEPLVRLGRSVGPLPTTNNSNSNNNPSTNVNEPLATTTTTGLTSSTLDGTLLTNGGGAAAGGTSSSLASTWNSVTAGGGGGGVTAGTNNTSAPSSSAAVAAVDPLRYLRELVTLLGRMDRVFPQLTTIPLSVHESGMDTVMRDFLAVLKLFLQLLLISLMNEKEG